MIPWLLAGPDECPDWAWDRPSGEPLPAAAGEGRGGGRRDKGVQGSSGWGQEGRQEVDLQPAGNRLTAGRIYTVTAGRK